MATVISFTGAASSPVLVSIAAIEISNFAVSDCGT
jgi:hypothetical protein